MPIVPGPTIKGIASGTTAKSSSLSSVVSDFLPDTIWIEARNSSVPAPTWNAGTVMPRTRKIRLPKKYTTKQMTRMARLVRRAQRWRAC